MFAAPLGRSTFTPPKSSFDSPLYGLVSLRRSHPRSGLGFSSSWGQRGRCPEGDRGRANVAAGNQEDRHHTIDGFLLYLSIDIFVFLRFASSQLSSIGRFGEIDRVLSEAGSDADDLNFELLSHISPIGWDNVLLYGEYQLNRSLVRSERLSV